MDNRTIEQIRENEDVLIKLIEAREQEIERLNNIMNEIRENLMKYIFVIIILLKI